ncbi:hypothetical protein [Paenibacillus sp. 1P07SE]|uniref:hypothetical protein n=1 Tax=Paenibacillus sp. 1P07SE TaxID=3132209 RepID=UPI0039A5E7F1
MFYSIIRNNRFVVIMADGVAETEILELPTETLADQVAFQLQMAWNDGETWGKEMLRKELNPESNRSYILETLLKRKSMSEEERKTESKLEKLRMNEQNRLLMEQVLSWKSRGIE